MVNSLHIRNGMLYDSFLYLNIDFAKFIESSLLLTSKLRIKLFFCSAVDPLSICHPSIHSSNDMCNYINELVLAYNGDVVETARFNFNGVFLNENARDTLSLVRA